jgi:gas vesicle protein
MSQKNIKGIVLGAIVGTLLGSLSAALMPKNPNLASQTKGLAAKAKNLGDTFYNGIKNWSEPRNEMQASTFVKGALSGLLLGAGAAAILTPKTGKQLRSNLTRKYQDLADKTQEIIHFINHEQNQWQSNRHPAASRRKPARRPAAKKTQHSAARTNGHKVAR